MSSAILYTSCRTRALEASESVTLEGLATRAELSEPKLDDDVEVLAVATVSAAVFCGSIMRGRVSLWTLFEFRAPAPCERLQISADSQRQGRALAEDQMGVRVSMKERALGAVRVTKIAERIPG